MNNEDRAAEYFMNGYNCAQAVFMTFCSKFGIDVDTSARISCGFGAGMGRLCKTCGAVSGAYMVIGLKYGNAKEVTYSKVREFTKRFIERNDSSDCCEILGFDLLTADNSLIKNRIGIICPKMVRDAVKILEDDLEL